MEKGTQDTSRYSTTGSRVFVTLDDANEVGIPAQIFRDEVAAIRDRREHESLEPPAIPPDGKPSAALGLRGLCISGGGIRSATFSTGVMQALAGADVLKEMDYLSTVSGGGYSGSSLTWALYGNVYEKSGADPAIREFIKSFGTGPDSFPTGTDDPAEPRKKAGRNYGFRLRLLDYLREHGNYLTPGGGITAFAALAVVLRGILLNLLVWAGLVTSLILLALLYFAPAPSAAWMLVAWTGGWTSVLLFCGLTGRVFPQVLVAIALAGLAVILAFVYGRPPEEGPAGGALFRCLAPTLGLVLTGAAVSVVYGVLTFFGGHLGKPSRRYQYRRFIERSASPYFSLLILAVTVGTLGWVSDLLGQALEATSLSMVVGGIASGFWTFSKSSSEGTQTPKIPIGLVAVVGAILLLYGGLLGTFALAEWAQPKSPAPYAWSAIAIVLVLGVMVNTNYISLGRYYRDRLMETYMPPVDRAIDDVTGGAPGADAAPLSRMWPKPASPERPARGPYHIVNTNLVLVDSENRKWRTRGGDSFILSPFYCGSSATGWRRTDGFERNTMTLATAMAISAAAANPNAGVAGQGLTRNKFVSLLMALLNFRLGSWVRNCNAGRVLPPNHFWPGGAYELLGGFRETSRWLMLSDGGHFENLALYEMIRRRLKLIVVLDGGADPEFNFADLQNAMRRVGADFGARIDFVDDDATTSKDVEGRKADSPLAALSYERTTQEGFFPLYPDRARRGWVRAKIKYEGWTEAVDKTAFEGDLVYVKTTLVDGLSVTTEGYRDANPTFPDQSTADQFFDTQQFEAYRDLGYRIGKDAACEVASILDSMRAPKPSPMKAKAKRKTRKKSAEGKPPKE